MWLRLLVSFLRVAAISDQLEREEETSSDATVKRLARLEEQVWTRFLVITNVAPVSVTFHIGERGAMQESTHVCLLNFISGRTRWKICHLCHCVSIHQTYLTHFDFVSSGCPISQSPAVDYGQSEISGFCSKRSTITELATGFLILY